MTDEQDGAPQETSGKSFDPFAKLRQGGFSEPQVQAWKSDADQRLKAAGFDDDKIGEFWKPYQVQPPKPPAQPPQPAMPYYARALTGNAEERDVEDPFGVKSRVRVGGAPLGEDFQMAARVIAQGAEPIAQTVEEKLRKLYDSRGMHPAEVATDAQGNLRLMQSLVSKGADEAEHYDVRPGWGMLSKAEQEQEVKQRIAAGRKVAETTIPMLERALAAAQSGPIPADVIAEMRASPYGASTGMMSVSSLEGALASARGKVAEAEAFEKGSHAPVTQTAWRSTPRALAAGALNSVASLGEGVGMARGWIGHWRAGHEIDDESIQQWIRSAKDWAAEMFPADQGRQGDILEHTASTLGMIGGLYGAGGVAKLAGAGPRGVAWAMGVAGAVGQGAMGHEEGVVAMKAPPVITEPTGAPKFAAAGGGIATGEPQESRPISHGAVLAGTIGQTAVGAAMALPFAKMATKGLPHETRLGRALIGAGEQAVMFPAFGIAGNLVSRETYDPSRQLFTDFWQSMGVGTAVGFITGMAAKGMPTPRRAIEYTPAELQGMLAEHPAMAEEYKKFAKAVIADDFMPTLDPKVRNDLIYVLDQVDPELANQLHDHQLPGEPRGPLAPVPEAAPHLQELERRLNETVQGFVAGVPVRVFEGEARPGEEARYLFGGQGAAEASLGKLRYAEEMEREQASPKEIWDQTGWHKDSDGKWKFEIDDSKATINLGEVKQNPNDPNQTGRRALLSEIVNHEELFKHYPYLGNVETLVVLDKSLAVDDGAGEVFEGFDKKLDFITNITVEAGSKEKALNIILHEVQHLIQSHEKFAKGARSEEVGEAEYQKAPGEIEARKVQERQRLTAEERRQSFPWLTQESSKQIMYSFGGQGAERPPLKDLTRAQGMERAGMIPSYIWEQTGWRKDVEGRWKFEIDDRLAFIDLSNRKAHPDDPNQTGVSARLGDILSHTKLFEQYPSLENIPTTVVIDKSKPKDFREGVHYPAAMGQKIYIKAGSEEAAERTLLHEAQHAIQEFEKFNPGSSPEYSKEFSVFKKVMADVSQKQGITPNTKEYERLWKKVAFQIYQRSAGEVEARNVEARQAMTEAERRDVEPWRTQDISDAERIVHDAAQTGSAEDQVISRAVDDAMYSFGGEGAKHAPSGRETAEMMEAEGLPRERIWEETGWHRGATGRWRFEIDDSQARINEDVLGDGSRPHNGTLGEVLSHDKLFEHYPYLKNVPVEIAVGDKWVSRGSVLEKNGNIQKILIARPTIQEIKRTLIHEIQHAIQISEGEKLVQGVPIEKWNEIVREVKKKFDPDILNKYGSELDESVRYSIYYLSKHELEARLSASRLELGEEERKAYHPFITKEALDIESEFQKLTGDELARANIVHEIVKEKLGRETFDETLYKKYLESDEYKDRVAAKQAELNSKIEKARAEQAAKEKEERNAEAERKARLEAAEKARIEKAEADRRAEAARLVAEEAAKADKEALRLEGRLKREQAEVDRLVADHAAASAEQARLEHEQAEAERRINESDAAIAKARADIEQAKAIITEAGQDFARLDAEIQEARKALQEMADQEEVDISPAPGQQVEPLAPIATLPARRPGKPIIEGYFDPKARTIWVSAAALDPELVVREEAAHAIKALGLYTPDEWAQLTVEARDNGWIDAMPNRELYEQKYGHLSPELLADALADEAVAKAFAGWRKGEVEVKGWVGQLFQRLANLLDRTGNWLKGQGFNTADDVGRLYGYQSSEQVFRAIEAGEFRRRQGELALREPGNVSRETEGAAGAGGPPMIPPTGAPPSRGFAPTPPPGGYTPQQIANARAAVLSRLSIGDPEQRQRFGAEQFYKHFLDKQYYVGKAVVTATGQRASGQEGLPTEANPYHLIRMAPGIAGKIDHFIMDGTFDFNTHEVTGEGLWPILDLIRGSAVDFSTFLASARNMELAGRGIATGIDVGASRIYGSSQTDRFAEPATRLYAWKDSTLAYLRDSGIISAESYDRIKAANKFHVAFHRVFDPEEQRMMISSTAQGGGVQPRNPVHTIKGSERRIVDPLESAIKDAAIFIKQAENNAITRSLVDMLIGFHAEAEAAATEGRAERVGEPAGAIERQPIDVDATAPVAEGLPGAQKKLGETRAGLPVPVELLPSDIAPEARAAAEEFLRNNGVEGAPPELVDWVAAEAAGPLPAGQVAVYREGRREIYRVDPELAQAIKGLNKESLGLIEKMLAIPAGTLRAGAVLTPQFGIRHLMRSFEYAFITGKGFFSPIDTAKGLAAIFGHSERYREWLRSGGANVAMVGLDRDYLQERLADMADYGLFTRTWNLVMDPERSAFAKAGAVLGLPVQTAQRYIMHPLRVWIEMSENAQHVGAFMKERRRQERAGETATIGTKAAIQRAGWESRETGVDIRRMGASMHAFNMITAFSNIILQDTDRVARAFVANPVSTLFRVGIAITAPSVLLWIANHDQKWYKNADDWEKDIFWMINTGTDDDENAVIWRIPKPFSAGVMFGTGPERALSAYFDGNKDELEKFIAGLHETSMPRFVPTAVSPLLEHWGNRSFFFNKNVVNKSQEQMLPEYQFTEYTTETAKAVARAISAIPGMREMALSKAASGHFMAQAMTSPVIMENYLRGWTGTLGMWALKTVDQAGFATGVYDRKLLPAATLADWPVIGSFVHRHPSAKAQNIQDFYDRYEVNTAYITTWRNLAKAGDALEAERVRQLGGDAVLVRLDSTMNALHAQHQLVGAVIRDKQMQPSDKRQLIDQIYRAMSFTADQGNAMMDMVEEQIKSQTRH